MRSRQESSPTSRAASDGQMVDVLARSHRVDYDTVGLGDFGRPDGFMERKLRRWGQQWERSKDAELPEID